MSNQRGRGFRGGRGSGNYRGSYDTGFGRGRGESSRGRGGFQGGIGRGSNAQVYQSPDRSIPQPNALVVRTENKFQEERKRSNTLSTLNLSENFPIRPGYGTTGVPVTLWANYFEFIPPKQLVLHRYDLSMSSEAAGRKWTQIVRLFLGTPAIAEYRFDIVTDFKKTLISRRKFETDPIQIEIPYRSEGEDEAREDATKYLVRLQYTNELSVDTLTEYISSTNAAKLNEDYLPMVQAFNIFLNHYSKSSGNLATIGSSKSFSLSSTTEKYSLEAGLTAIRGFFSSVRLATCRILVNVNVSHGAFVEAGTLVQLINNHYNSTGSYVKLHDFLKKVRVRTTHLPEKKNRAGEVVHRIKTICGLATKDDGHQQPHPPKVGFIGSGAKEVQFWLEETKQSLAYATSQGGGKAKGKGKKEKRAGPSVTASGPSVAGRYISVFDFFKQTHGISIPNPKLPVVNVGNRENPIYLPPDVCIVLPGQNSNKKLDPRQTAGMIKFAVRPPWQNAKSIVEEGFETVGLSSVSNKLLREFGFSVSPKLITVPGRILNGPKVVYSQNKWANVRFGSWNMQEIKFSSCGSIKDLGYLHISFQQSRPFDSQAWDQTTSKFQKALQNVGISTPAPKGIGITIRDEDDSALEEKIRRASQVFSILLVLLPEMNVALYNRVKFYGDVKYGIPTVCCQQKKVLQDKGQEQYFANVALKFNLKLGGVNQVVDSPGLGLIEEDKTMIVGIDVTHPSPGSSSNAPSVAGMVASVDKKLGQWPAVLRIQEARKESVTFLKEMLTSRLQNWRSRGRHASLPENILVYRDGVSEGQYQMVIDEELPQLREACKELYPPADQKRDLPAITIIVVGKRHHTRFYPTREGDADRSSNPKPGTVVDRGVTEAHHWDFFLQSHAALQGTARPAHYFVVHDEIFRRRYRSGKGGRPLPPDRTVADMLEELTHAMCYTYGRATKAVSLCPPAYYADLVCERARCYLSGVYGTPPASAAASVAGSAKGKGKAPEEELVSNDSVKVHDRLKDTMFYI